MTTNVVIPANVSRASVVPCSAKRNLRSSQPASSRAAIVVIGLLLEPSEGTDQPNLKGESAGTKPAPNGSAAVCERGASRGSGEGRNRTGDTTVFSRVLYQLSYLAKAGEV